MFEKLFVVLEFCGNDFPTYLGHKPFKSKEEAIEFANDWAEKKYNACKSAYSTDGISSGEYFGTYYVGAMNYDKTDVAFKYVVREL